MAKGYRVALALICFSISLCQPDALAADTTRVSKPPTTRAALALVYNSQVGVTEKGCGNCGPQVKRYLASSGNREGQPWCAAFVNWCFQQLGLKGPAGAGAARNWFPAAKVIYRRGARQVKEPQQGDCAGYYYANLGRIGHIGFIDKWGENFVVTVEGNTGGGSGVNREGDGVRRMRRLRSQISIVSSWIPKS